MTPTCTCGAALPTSGSGRVRKFCSAACCQAFHNKRYRSLEKYEYDPAKAQAYYLANREKSLARGRAWRRANSEKCAAIRARGNDKAWVRTRIQAADIASIARKIPEDRRQEYAEWVVLVAQQCPYTAGILGHAKVMAWLSRYVDTEAITSAAAGAASGASTTTTLPPASPVLERPVDRPRTIGGRVVQREPAIP